MSLDAHDQGAPFGAVLRAPGKERTLSPREYTALWQLCGAKRRRGGFPPPAHEVDQLGNQLLAEGFLVDARLDGAAALGPQDELCIASDLDLRPALYQVLDAQGRPMRLVGAGTPARPNQHVRPDAFLARRPGLPFAALVGSEEAELLDRCRQPCAVAALANEQPHDAAWVQGVLKRALAAGIVEHAVSAADLDDDLGNPTFLERGQDGRIEENTNPNAAAFADEQGQTVANAPAYAAPAPMIPAMPAMDPQMDARVARLAALSLDKDNVASSIAPSSVAPVSRSNVVVPWVLLALFVVGGTTYHVITVRDLKAQVRAAPAADPAASTPAQASRPRMGLIASGYIAAKAPIVLSATTSGRLDTMNVDNGASIKKGQILAVVADGQIRAELSLANAKIRDAQRALSRTKQLVRAQAATPVDLERAVGQVEIAAAEARVIQQKLEDTKIKSPIDGTVLEVLAHPGETVTAGPNAAGILRIADLTQLIAEVNVNESELKNVAMGQEVEISAEAQRDQTYKGTVREIAEQADRAKGTVLVKVDIETTPETALKPGMAVEARFKAPSETSASTKP